MEFPQVRWHFDRDRHAERSRRHNSAVFRFKSSYKLRAHLRGLSADLRITRRLLKPHFARITSRPVKDTSGVFCASGCCTVTRHRTACIFPMEPKRLTRSGGGVAAFPQGAEQLQHEGAQLKLSFPHLPSIKRHLTAVGASFSLHASTWEDSDSRMRLDGFFQQCAPGAGFYGGRKTARSEPLETFN